MKKTLFRIFLLYIVILPLNIQAQSSIPNSPQTGLHTRLSILAPGLEIEAETGSSTTIVFKLLAGFSYTYTEFNGKSDSDWTIDPFFCIEPRFYTNSIKDRPTGPYIGIPLTIVFTNASYSGGPVIGYTNKIGKNGFFYIGIGAGIRGGENEHSFGLISEGGIGISLK